MGVAAEVLRIAREEARGARIAGMKLKVGLWSGVEVESLRFAIEALGEGTETEGCRVEIERVRPAFDCPVCAVPYEAEDRFAPCPRCGGPGGALVAGDEMLLCELDVED